MEWVSYQDWVWMVIRARIKSSIVFCCRFEDNVVSQLQLVEKVIVCNRGWVTHNVHPILISLRLFYRLLFCQLCIQQVHVLTYLQLAYYYFVWILLFYWSMFVIFSAKLLVQIVHYTESSTPSEITIIRLLLWYCYNGCAQ